MNHHGHDRGETPAGPAEGTAAPKRPKEGLLPRTPYRAVGVLSHGDEFIEEPCVLHRIQRGQRILALDWPAAGPIEVSTFGAPDHAEHYGEVVADVLLAAAMAGVRCSDVIA